MRVAAMMCALCATVSLVRPAIAQPKKGKPSTPAAAPADGGNGASTSAGPTAKPDAKLGKGEKGSKVQNFDFNALDLNGRMRTPQLLYFLERANEELERASLEKRSFIPHMVRSIEEEAL